MRKILHSAEVIPVCDYVARGESEARFCSKPPNTQGPCTRSAR
jgi:hypothetical protein